MGRDAALGIGVHLMRADLDLHGLGAGSDDGRVNRTVAVVLRGGDVVVELPGDELPQRMHHAERRIAFRDAVHQDARRANVHELLEGELLGLHLAPDAVDVLRPALDDGLDAGALQFAAQQRLQLFHVALAFGAPHLERGGDAFVVGRLKVAKRQILELPLQLPHAQAIGERRIHLARLGGELALQDGFERFGGAHFLQLPGEPHDHQTHIADDRQQHLAQRLGLAGLEALLGRPIGR